MTETINRDQNAVDQFFPYIVFEQYAYMVVCVRLCFIIISDNDMPPVCLSIFTGYPSVSLGERQ
jgi:hypothetical protein